LITALLVADAKYNAMVVKKTDPFATKQLVCW